MEVAEFDVASKTMAAALCKVKSLARAMMREYFCPVGRFSAKSRRLLAGTMTFYEVLSVGSRRC